MLDPRAQEHEIAAAARHYVGRVRAHLAAFDSRIGAPQTVQELAGTLNGIAVLAQARPVAPGVSLSGRIARMLDSCWWTRNLRRSLLRENEAIEHAQGRIRRSASCYVSDHAMRVKAARAKTNRAILEALEVVSDAGHVANLADVADGSVSNPKLRRGELMVRCRGFEEIAQAMGHEAVFLTITCPSRFHRFDGQGKPNAKWNGSTPRDAQRYLCETWAKIRAGWKREGFAPYGFRVAEPHHDGCPHWHLLLFAPETQTGWFVPRRFVADRTDAGAGLVGIAGRYALEDSPGEPGALKHRFTCEKIDTSKGSATGYIAKYISKNIDGEKEDGEAVGLDFASGTRAIDAAKRVRTWAQTWGIRQFQQIGGPSVTVWRELRRLAKDAQSPVLQLELFEGPRSAADRAMWALFWFLQGGPDVPRSELTLRPMYAAQGGGRYGDELVRVRGVLGLDGAQVHEQVTREHTWTVQAAGLAAVNVEMQARNDAFVAARALGFPNPEAYGVFMDVAEAFRGLDFERSGEAASPWTGVNNCTDDDDDAALRADLLRGQGGKSSEIEPSCDVSTWQGFSARPPNPPNPTNPRP